ncbi:MAG TPA: SGNH/GDSL hydrolase family protein [Myxococcota bacterium]|nr:SGNH/GDSL hydrolase family protein [Myxococcota bacterium]
MSRRKPLFALIAVVVVLVLLELGAMPLAPPIHRSSPQDDTMQGSALLGWEPVPGQRRMFGSPEETTINDLGTRNPQPHPKAPGSLRLMSLGDSTVFGVLVGDEQVFSAVAARNLERELGRSVDAYNGGVPGYSSEQASRLFRHRLYDQGADVLLICTIWSDSQLGPPDAVVFPERAAALRVVLQRSALFRLLDTIAHGGEAAQVVEWRLGGDEPIMNRVPLSAYEDNLHGLAGAAEDAGARPVFVVLPSDRDLDGRDLEKPRPAYRDTMRAVAADLGATLVDTPPHFAGLPPSTMLDDVHPSAAGHRLIGELIAEALADELR